MDEKVFTFSWEVANFSCFTNQDIFSIQSGAFVAENLTDTLIGYFIARVQGDKDFINFKLKRCDYDPVTIGLGVTFQLIPTNGTPGIEITLTETDITEKDVFAFLKVASRSEVERRYLHNDTLRMKCVLRKTDKGLTTKRLFARTSAEWLRKYYRVWALTNFSEVRQTTFLGQLIKLPEEDYLLLDVCLSIEECQSDEVVIIQFTRCCDLPWKLLSLNALITVLDAQWIDSEIWKKDQHVFHFLTQEEVWKFPSFINKAPLVIQKNKYLANDVLNLKFEITMSLGTVTSKIEETSFFVEKSYTQSVDTFTEDMKDLFSSKRFPDVKLRVFGETVPAHRIVLQSRSKKFAEMLDDVEGTHNGVLDLLDVSMITLKRMLKYMYTDEIDELEYDDVVVAYVTANKYKIESLKCKYSFVLQSQLKVNNVCSIFKLADEFCDQELKNCALDFMKLYREFEEWEGLSRDRQLLAKEPKEQAIAT